MWIWLLIAVLLFILTVVVSHKDIRGVFGWFGTTLACVALGGVLSVGLTMMIWGVSYEIVTHDAETEWVEYNDYPIYALQDNTNSTVTYYLRSAKSDANVTYYYLAKHGNGHKMYSINHNQATLIETTEQPKIKSYTLRYKDEWISDLYGDPYGWSYEIYVPKGSIEYDFDVNLQ